MDCNPPERKAVTFFLNASAYVGIQVVAVTPESKSLQPSAVEITPRRSRRIRLRSGGAVELKLEFDPFRLSIPDREFVFELVDRLRQYEQHQDPDDSESASTDPHFILEIDDVPF